MRSRRQRTYRRWLVFGGLTGVLLISILNWWQAYARKHGKISPAEQALVSVLSPSIRIAGFLRNAVTPSLEYAVKDGLPAVGIARLNEVEAENERLRTLLDLRSTLPDGAIAADVIGRSNNPWQGHLLLGKGAKAGITPHMVVLSPDGVIGQIAVVTPHTAQVLLLTDPASGIGAMLSRTQETGVLKGYTDGRCQMVYLSDQSVVQQGDLVVTSGLSDFFPKGLPLGKVISVKEDPSLSSRTAIVEPVASPSRTDLVIVTKRAGAQ